MRKGESGRRSGGAALALAVAGGALVFTLGGCGQSGPLRLPEKTSLSAPTPAPATVSPPAAGRAAPDRLAHG